MVRPRNRETMRAITLYEPYCTLVCLGEKCIETRHWSTDYRGRLRNHASKTFPKWCKLLINEEPFFSILKSSLLTRPESFQLGVVKATVDLIDVLPVRNVRDKLTKLERAFGDYSPGRFAWILANPKVLEHPVAAKGALGLWEWKIEI